MLLVVSACHGASRDAAGDWPAAAGAPVAAHRSIRRLVNHGFTVGYDTRRARAAWVAFRLTAIHGFNSMTRPEFSPDPRLSRHPDAEIYKGAPYDRGHMAPNYAIRQLYGARGQRQTFYYSNVVPQRSRLNQLLWQRLEEVEIDDIAPRVKTLWVVTGPIPARSGHAPKAFYRIWLAHKADGGWAALAFRMPQRVRGDERLSRYIVSVDSIEAATGLDFFAGLPEDVQASLESRPEPASTFGFARYACEPARYGKRWQGRRGIHLHYDRCRGD